MRDLQTQHPSPSHTHVLSLVHVSCGAVGGDTELRLGRDATAGEVVASISRWPVVQITWVDDSWVQIFVPEGYAKDLKKPRYDGVQIEFR